MSMSSSRRSASRDRLRSHSSRARTGSRGLWAVLVVGAGIATLWTVRVLTSPNLVEPNNPELLNEDLALLIDEHLDAVRDAPESIEAWAELGAVYEANFLWEEARERIRCKLR